MNIITLTKENLEAEHICCAISNNKDIQVSSKKAWLAAIYYTAQCPFTAKYVPLLENVAKANNVPMKVEKNR